MTVEDPHYEKLFEVDIDYVLRLDPVRLRAGFRAVSTDQDQPEPRSLGGSYDRAGGPVRTASDSSLFGVQPKNVTMLNAPRSRGSPGLPSWGSAGSEQLNSIEK